MAGERTVEAYIERLGDWRGAVIRELTAIVADVAPEATSSIKWAQPVWESNGPFAYAKAFPASVNFGFWRGAGLDDPDGLLEGDGDRMKHVKLRSATDVRSNAFRAFVGQAVELNRTRGNPTQRHVTRTMGPEAVSREP